VDDSLLIYDQRKTNIDETLACSLFQSLITFSRHNEKRNAYRLLVGKPDGRRLLGRPRHLKVANIKMDLGETGLSRMDWIGLAQNKKWRALVNVKQTCGFHKMLGNYQVAT
jgi:hypothetical protein